MKAIVNVDPTKQQLTGLRAPLRATALVALLSVASLSGAEAQSQQRGEQRRQLSAHELRCAQLEQELSTGWIRGSQARDQRPKIEAQIKRYSRVYRRAEADAERANCYQKVFIFGKSLRRTPRCLKIHNRIEDARRQLARLEEQKAATSRGGESRRREDLIDALASYGCSQPQQRANRGRGLFGWLTDDGDYFDRPRRGLSTSKIEPYATYRTLCVRTCDGYYFPVSFSTLPSKFASDAAQCTERCAAPAELFVYRNPGEEPEQMVSSDGQRAYNDTPNAWKYRKQFVKGCSCKSAEYDPEEIAKATQDAATQKDAVGAAPKVAGEGDPATKTQ